MTARVRNLTRLLLALAVAPALFGQSSEALVPRAVPGGVEFSLRAPLAGRVSIAGDFNGWSTGKHVLDGPDARGVWSIVLPLAPGDHEYLLLVDGRLPERGGRVEGRAAMAFSTHQPLDMRLHLLVPVNVCHVLPGGSLRREPDEPVLFALLDAWRVAFSDSDSLHPQSYQRAMTHLRQAAKQAPRDAALRRMLEREEASFALEQRLLETRRLAWDRDLESAVGPLLNGTQLSEGEKARLREDVRELRQSGAERGSCEPIARLAQVAYWRGLVPGKLEQWRASPLDPEAVHGLRVALDQGYAESDPAGLAEWRDVLNRAVWPGGATSAARDVEEYLDALAALRGQDRNEGLRRLLACLRKQGIPGWIVALDANLVPSREPVEGGLWILRNLADRPDLRRDYLHRALGMAPGLRDQPLMESILTEALAGASDPVMAHRLASRLAALYLVHHREEELYALVRTRLEVDPCDLELLGNFAGFLETMAGIERAYKGLLSNPWKPRLLERLEQLRPVAPENPALMQLLAREMSERGKKLEAAGVLRAMLSRRPSDAFAALELAELMNAAGDRAEALEAIERCWKARPCGEFLARAMASALGRSGKLGELRTFLAQRFQDSDDAAAAVGGATEGLLTSGTSEAALAFFRSLEVTDAHVRSAARRSALRLAVEAGRQGEVEALAAKPPEGITEPELWHYASLAAASRGKEALSSAWLERALAQSQPRRWLLEALDGSSESLATRVAEETVGALRQAQSERNTEESAPRRSAAQNPVPFLRYLASRELRSGRPERAAAYLRGLLQASLVPEDQVALRSGLALAELRACRPLVAMEELSELAAAGAAPFWFLLVSAALPIVFVGSFARLPGRRG